MWTALSSHTCAAVEVWPGGTLWLLGLESVCSVPSAPFPCQMQVDLLQGQALLRGVTLAATHTSPLCTSPCNPTSHSLHPHTLTSSGRPSALTLLQGETKPYLPLQPPPSHNSTLSAPTLLTSGGGPGAASGLSTRDPEGRAHRVLGTGAGSPVAQADGWEEGPARVRGTQQRGYLGKMVTTKEQEKQRRPKLPPDTY